jgi:hypothetical protein
MLIRLECVCEECDKVVCSLTIDIEVEKGKAYRPPNRCIAEDKLVAWRIDRIEIAES